MDAPKQPSPKRAKREMRRLKRRTKRRARRKEPRAKASKAIRRALATEEGRTAIAEAMIEPIRRQLDYQGIGRQIFNVEPIPPRTLKNGWSIIEHPTFVIQTP